MSKSMKIISLVTAIVLVLGVAATIIVMVVSYDPDKPRPGFYIDGDRIGNTGTMLTVGEHEIGYAEYRYYYYYNKYYISMGDTTYWDSDPDGSKAQNLKEETEEYIKYVYAWADLAAERGVGLSEEEKQDILDDVAEDKRTYGTEFKNKLLENYLMDEETYVKIMEMETIQQKMQAELTTEINSSDEYADKMYDGIVTAKHILISFSSDGGEEDQAQTLETAEEVRQMYLDELAAHEAELAEEEGAEAVDEMDLKAQVFEELRLQYDADTGQPEEGYTFAQGTMVEEFYQGALALEEGEVSEPILTNYGYHIILRLPLNMTYVEENKDSLTSSKISGIIDDMIQERMDAMSVTPGEYYDRVSLASVK